MSDKQNVNPGQLTEQQMQVLTVLGMAARAAVKQPTVRQAIQNVVERNQEPVSIERTIDCKNAPIDEGKWEFKLREGVLEIIAWSDDKTKAQVVRLTRRGVEIHLMHNKPTDPEEQE
jgi:hypothetical protein